VYHLFVIRVPDRDRFQRQLAADGIETLVHYPLPIPRQQAFTHMAPADCPMASRACDEVLSLPLHPGLSNDDLDSVVLAAKGHGCAG
jgi:dTDP-4-amino-4,6-dideoxygalactose transaminase